MAQVVGGKGGRVGSETLRTLTTVAAVVLVVAALFAGIKFVSAGASAVLVAVVLVVVTAGLVVGKLVLDRRLGAGPGGRRAEDTEAVAGDLASLPDSWWVFRDFFFGGSGVEFLAVGPGGAFAVEVFRWLARDTGTSFHERVTSDLRGRAADLEAAIGRASGLGSTLCVQPVFVCLEGEGLRLGEILLHPSAPDLRHVCGVLIATRGDLLPLLRAGGPRDGVRTRTLEPDMALRLGRFLKEKAVV